jgi:hypothetical protein
MNIDGTTIKAYTTAKFLGVAFQSKRLLDAQYRETIRQITQRVRALNRITGTRKYPRASEKLGTTILRLIIYSLTQYAPTIQVLKSESQFKEQDKIILTGTRNVLHIPKTISGDYVRTQTDIPQPRKTKAS